MQDNSTSDDQIMIGSDDDDGSNLSVSPSSDSVSIESCSTINDFPSILLMDDVMVTEDVNYFSNPVFVATLITGESLMRNRTNMVFVVGNSCTNKGPVLEFVLCYLIENRCNRVLGSPNQHFLFGRSRRFHTRRPSIWWLFGRRRHVLILEIFYFILERT